MDLTLTDFFLAVDNIGPIAAEEMQREFTVASHSAALGMSGDAKIQDSFKMIVENMSLTADERTEREQKRVELLKLKEKYEAMGITGIKIN